MKNMLQLLLLFLCVQNGVLWSMQPDGLDQIEQRMQNLNLNDPYYSDSEDEEGYEYAGLSSLEIPEEKCRQSCIPLVRGIHFSPSTFTRQDISRMRRENDKGKDIFCSAAYDLANKSLGSSDNTNEVFKQACKIQKIIKKSSLKDRNTFQEIYTNQYDIFHRNLGNKEKSTLFGQFTSQKNPQVSTGESIFHGGKYALGLKFLGANVELLDPAYDNRGKPRHPYLGKLFVLLVGINQVKELSPYFVAYGHANGDINVSYHYSKNILAEREVSFPGLIPGNCVALSFPVRVPSFQGDYKSWYKEKFGISKRAYNARKKILTTGKYYQSETKSPEEVKKRTVKNLLQKIILPHLEKKLSAHIEQECKSKGITLKYKQLNGTFGTALPAMFNIKNQHQLNKKK